MDTWKITMLGIIGCMSACAPDLRVTGGTGGAGGESASSSGTAGTGGQGGSGVSTSSSSSNGSSSSSTSSGGSSSSSSSSGSSSSSSGGGGMGPIGTLGQPCPMVGMLGCAGNAQKSQIICGSDFTWQTNGTCGPGLLCDTSPGVNQGTCQPIVGVCQGEQPGAIVCNGKTRVECGPDLVTTTVVETCQFGCQSGACTGECTPGATQCVGNFIRTCSALGQWQMEVPCPDSAPRCIAGQCMEPSSCQGLAKTCGPQGNESCCTSILVPGGTYNRINNASYPATVSDYRLDKFEVTVGRFRKFFEGYPNNKPVAGAGGHVNIPNSGWDATWDAQLPATQAALQTAIQCIDIPNWTSTAGANETKPMNCIDWYVLFAFCAWDSGYLPTEAQWNYAAAGGNEQRAYPWGAAAPDTTYASFSCGAGGTPGACTAADILNVGAYSPKGDGKYGQSDLAGGVYEWVLDKWASPYANITCNNCADLVSGASRVVRGGDWKSTMTSLPNTSRGVAGPTFKLDYLAGRCARRP